MSTATTDLIASQLAQIDRLISERNTAHKKLWLARAKLEYLMGISFSPSTESCIQEIDDILSDVLTSQEPKP